MLRILAAAAIALLLIPAAGPARAADKVIHARCAAPGEYLEVGAWENSSASANVPGGPACASGSRYTSEPGAYAEFSPHVDAPGDYMVYVGWGAFDHVGQTNKGPNADHVTFSIIDVNGARSTVLDERGQSGCSNRNSDQWIALGVGTFTPAGDGKVRITNTADGQCFNGKTKRFVNVDAVQLVALSVVPVEPASWGLLKARYR